MGSKDAGQADPAVLDAELRARFDAMLESVLASLPAWIQRLVEQVPVVVDDVPSARDMRRLGVRSRRALCGLYTGIPLTERSVQHSGVLLDKVQIFRLGVIAAASDRLGHVPDRRLRRQIRITVLHEIGHHFGLDEADLRYLGYR